MPERKHVTYLRKGNPVQVDRQVYLWRKRRRKAAAIAAERRECIEAVIAFHSGDISLAKEWLNTHQMPRYQNLTPMTLLKRGRFKGIHRELKELNRVRS